ncbi:unnamed protein product, partial [Rotaria sordida]
TSYHIQTKQVTSLDDLVSTNNNSIEDFRYRSCLCIGSGLLS